MELTQLKYFKTVAGIGKISEAAQVLFISPSALSTSISRLEKELETNLFDRTNNSIRLNQQGRILLRYANRIFNDLENVRTEIRHSVMLQGKHVSITSVMSTPWVDMITAFSQENPQFTLSCSSIKCTELADNGLPAQHTFLLAGEDEIPASYANKLESTALFEDSAMIAVHPDHPLGQLKSIKLSQLQDQTLFLPMQEYPVYRNLVKMYELCGLPFPAGNAYSLLTGQQMAAKGLGVAFTTRYTVRSHIQPLQYIPIGEPPHTWACRLYWRKNHTFTEDERTFKEFVEEYYRGI